MAGSNSLWTRIKHPLESLGCAAMLAVAAFAVLHPAFLEDTLPWNSAPLYTLPPWEQAREAGIVYENPGDDTTFTLRYYPWYRFIHDAGLKRDSVLWNPNEHAGMPFLAMWRTRCLSPFTVPMYLLPFEHGLRVSAFLKLFLAGVAAFYCARSFGLSKPAALVPALAWELSAGALLWLESPLADAMPALPLVVASAELMGTRFAAWPLGVIGFGVMFLAGAPEVAATGLVLAAAYLVLSRGPIPAVPILGRVAACAAGGGALAAAQILPAAELYAHLAPAPAGVPEALSPFDWIAWALPSAVTHSIDPTEVARNAAPLPALLHLGAVVYGLLALWTAIRIEAPEKRRRRFDALFLAAFAPIALGLPLMYLLPPHPFFSEWGLQFMLFPLPLVAGLAAAAAIQEWVLLDPEQSFKVLRRLSVAIAVLVALIGVTAGISLAAEDVAIRASDLLISAGLLTALCVLLGWTLLHPSLRLGGYGAAVLIAVNNFAVFYPMMRFSPADTFFPTTEFIETLVERGGRVSGTRQLEQWPVSGNGLSQLYGDRAYRLQRQAGFVERLTPDPLLLRRTGSPNLLLTKLDIQGSFAPVRPMLRVEHVFATGAVLFEDLDTDSRARMVYEARPVSFLNFDDIQSALPPIVERPESLEQGEGPRARAHIQEPESNSRIVVTVDQTRPGLLVLADAYYPGWRAEVNGQPARILAVDGMFRGVVLGAGTHEVVFKYRPISFIAGTVISLLTVLVLVALAVRHRRKSPFNVQ